jgi:exosortase O
MLNEPKQNATEKAHVHTKYASAILGAGVLILWMWHVAPSFSWYLKNLFAGHATFSLLAFSLASVFWFRDFRIKKELPIFEFKDSKLALVLVAIALTIMVSNRYYLHLNTLRAFSSSLLTLGVVGLVTDRYRYSRSLPLGIFICALVPLEKHIETFVGFPLRLLTAEATTYLLGSLGMNIQGMSTILVVENAASSVDSVCSGVKTIWAGMLFFMLASYTSQQKFNVKWITKAFLILILLVLANFLRVLLLSVIALAIQSKEIFNLLHLPLGAFAFAAVCLYASQILPRNGGTTEIDNLKCRNGSLKSPIAAFSLLIFSVLLTPMSIEGSIASERKFDKGLNINFTANMITTPIPLTDQEKAFFIQNQGASVSKWRFTHNNDSRMTGTLIISLSRSGIAQHDPLQCLLGSGNEVQSLNTILVSRDFPAKVATINRGHSQVFYWFQSEQGLTDEFSHRFWAGLFNNRPWVMVSVLFDSAANNSPNDILNFLKKIRIDIAHIFSDEEINHDVRRI